MYHPKSHAPANGERFFYAQLTTKPDGQIIARVIPVYYHGPHPDPTMIRMKADHARWPLAVKRDWCNKKIEHAKKQLTARITNAIHDAENRIAQLEELRNATNAHPYLIWDDTDAPDAMAWEHLLETFTPVTIKSTCPACHRLVNVQADPEGRQRFEAHAEYLGGEYCDGSHEYLHPDDAGPRT